MQFVSSNFIGFWPADLPSLDAVSSLPSQGLLGTIVITANAMSNFDGNPIDAEQTVVTLMHTFDEAQSPLLYDNIQKYGTRDLIDAVAAMGVADQASLSAALAVAGGLEAVDPATALALKKHTVNGMSFCNLPGISLSEGVSFRWHIAAPGSVREPQAKSQAAACCAGNIWS